jgi:hypothetical protein
MASPDGKPPPVSNPITGTWRYSFADKDQKGRALQKFDRVEELVCDHYYYYIYNVSKRNTKYEYISQWELESLKIINCCFGHP